MDDPYPGLPTLPLVDHQVVGERVDRVQPHPRACRNHLTPLGPVRGPVGCLHQPEVLGPVIGDDEEAAVVAPTLRVAPVVVDAVLDAVAPGLDHRELPPRVVRGQCLELGGHLGIQAAQDEPVVLGTTDAEVEAVVGLLEDQHVVRGVGADPVAPQLVGAHGLVHPDEEHGGVVVGPGHPIGRVLERLR